jgi:transposase InsO family protein
VEPPRRIVRYERDRPGELVHLDVKKLGRIQRVGHRIRGGRRGKARGQGWEYVHVAIDDYTRLAFSEVLPDETATTALGYLTRAVVRGFAVERVLMDNGSCYRGLPFAEGTITLGISQRFPRPYRPQTNGKAERFIRTLLNEWAYARGMDARAGARGPPRALPLLLLTPSGGTVRAATGLQRRGSPSTCQQRAEALNTEGRLTLRVIAESMGQIL